MGITTGIILFLLIWWIMLFTTLPLWVKRVENPELGHNTGAPEHHNLLKKCILTTFLAAAVWLLIYFLIRMDVIDFRQWANITMEQGLKE